MWCLICKAELIHAQSCKGVVVFTEITLCWDLNHLTFTPHKNCICRLNCQRIPAFPPYIQLFSLRCCSCRVQSRLQYIVKDLILPRFSLLLLQMFLASSQILIEMFSLVWGEGGGAGIQRHWVGGEAVLIALKVTRLRRPTLTRYPYCRQQTKCGPEEQHGLISVIMNGLRPMNQSPKLCCLKISQQFFIALW